jgi:hypothetical protein
MKLKLLIKLVIKICLLKEKVNSMRKFKKQQEESQIIWKNTNHEAPFNPFRNYFAVVKIGDKSYLTEYTAKFRSEAVAVFEEECRLSGGYVESIGVFK